MTNAERARVAEHRNSIQWETAFLSACTAMQVETASKTNYKHGTISNLFLREQAIEMADVAMHNLLLFRDSHK